MEFEEGSGNHHRQRSEGLLRQETRKQELAASLRVSGAPEVQGAVATFLVDDDWPKCLATLDDGLADSDDEDDERRTHSDAVRAEPRPPYVNIVLSIRETTGYSNARSGTLLLMFLDPREEREETVIRQQQRADEAKVLVDSFVRGLRREAFDADADKDTIVEHLPDDADLWSQCRPWTVLTTIKARTLYDERAKSAHRPWTGATSCAGSGTASCAARAARSCPIF